jgi:DNA-binding winged helix-turn-helix (wHTH) protein/tetratricopeptide (TPR) repeat protein
MAHAARAPLTFLDVELDVENERVIRGGEVQHLRQRAFAVLIYLIEHRDRVVSKDELLDRVWAGVSVSEDALVQCIVEIRRALGDASKEPRFVRTVLKRGYQFIAPPSDVPSHPAPPASADLAATIAIEPEGGATSYPATTVRSVAIVLIAAVCVVSLALVGWRSFRNESAAASLIPSPIPSPPADALTADSEALRLYTLGLERANAFASREAIALFEKAIARDPEFAMAHARIGYVLGVHGYEIAAARPYIRRALTLQQRMNEKERLIVSAWEAIVTPDFETAIERYRLIVDRYPTDLESHRRLAALLIGEEQIAEGVAILERAAAIDPNDAQIQNAMGGAYSLLGRHAQSIAARKRYVELEPQEANAWDSLGISYNWAGRYEEALAAYERASALRPDFDLVRYHRAATLVALGRFREAVAEVESCLAHARTDVEKSRVFATLADIYRLAGDPVAERAAVTRIPNNVPMLVLSRAYYAGNEDVPPSRLQRFSGRGMRPVARFELTFHGMRALHEGRHDEALDLLRRAGRYQPAIWHVDPFDTSLADACLELKRYEEAAREYARLLETNSRHARALFGLARAQEHLGQHEEARATYRRFLAVWKDADPDARDLRAARASLAMR